MTTQEAKDRLLPFDSYMHLKSFRTLEEAQQYCIGHPEYIIRCYDR